jgi:hypothetical protein
VGIEVPTGEPAEAPSLEVVEALSEVGGEQAENALCFASTKE